MCTIDKRLSICLAMLQERNCYERIHSPMQSSSHRTAVNNSVLSDRRSSVVPPGLEQEQKRQTKSSFVHNPGNLLKLITKLPQTYIVVVTSCYCLSVDFGRRLEELDRFFRLCSFLSPEDFLLFSLRSTLLSLLSTLFSLLLDLGFDGFGMFSILKWRGSPSGTSGISPMSTAAAIFLRSSSALWRRNSKSVFL
mmetsp:Transcript_5039/g.12030  ORF Transcript_5039/g.12030 Transcript_5039/m.12030 type:complete len:194 (+) Transcript_5039:2429-3010(+)